MIDRKKQKWLSSDECTVKDLIEYIRHKGQLRIPQIEALETYLFLKICCHNKPLWELFSEGYFNLNIDSLSIPPRERDVLKYNPAAQALLEYSILQGEDNKRFSQNIKDTIIRNINKINFQDVFRKIFYDITYTDYLFSLPMGAGKTFLMAAFIYIDLYFALTELDNKAFSHNFIIFAPSGLKSSVVPSLRTIKSFDPSWVLPEPAASGIKRIIRFEVLDRQSTKSRSNKTRNPNVQRINQYQPLDELMGLVAVTNAEKVILDKTQMAESHDPVEEIDENNRQTNELRNLMGKISRLSVFIDEVHHASSYDIKLRQVVANWAKNNGINSVIGFSGTPYLSTAHTVKIADDFNLKISQLSNVVYYYPLIKGINNFLKNPVVKIVRGQNSLQIIESGVKHFLDMYKDKTYENGTRAKLAVYCGKISTLEEIVYPKVAEIVREYGLCPGEAILKYHKGNAEYKISPEAEVEYLCLDTPASKKRIILLVQIGKEGWDCRSLTGVILSQKGDCPTNMVLQTSCRCLRQVDAGKFETAAIWLNEYNAQKLHKQLKEEHHITIDEFIKAGSGNNAYNSYQQGRLKSIDDDCIPSKALFCKQEAEEIPIDENITNMLLYDLRKAVIAKTMTSTQLIENDTPVVYGELNADFNGWILQISKESFGFVSMDMLKKHYSVLKDIFNNITYLKDNIRYYNDIYEQDLIRAAIRKAFYKGGRQVCP